MCLTCHISEAAKLESQASQGNLAHRIGRLPAGLMILVIEFYRRYISRFSPPSCRFTPTCSRYALDSLRRYGLIRGCWLATWRVLRCNPFHPGGYDPLT